MAQPDTLLLKSTFEQVDATDILVTPTGGTQVALANQLGSPTFTAVTATTATITTITSNGLDQVGATNAFTAFAGGGQGSATPLISMINRVTTVATAADSVLLPLAVAGRQVTVINAAAANAMAVFPRTGEIINALSADASISVAANKTIIFSCAVTGTWNSVLTA